MNKISKSFAKVLATSLATSVLLSAVSNSVMASDDQKIRWKVQAAFGTHLPALGDPIKLVAEQIKKASGGDIRFKVYEPGKIVPPLVLLKQLKTNNLVLVTLGWVMTKVKFLQPHYLLQYLLAWNHGNTLLGGMMVKEKNWPKSYTLSTVFTPFCVV